MWSIEVVPYSESWPALFEKEKKLIEGILGDALCGVFHIGSTAVPGLWAKPVIDIMPVVKSLAEADKRQDAFEKAGYEWMGELGIAGRRFLKKGGDARSHHIHIFQYNNTWDILRHLAFRDHLRAEPGLRRDYEDLKRQLAAQSTNLDAYCDGKEDFVQRAQRQALAWYWAQQAAQP